MDSIVKNLIEYVGIDTQIPPDYSVYAFKEITTQEQLHLPDCFPDIEQITRVKVCVEITNAYVINTPVSARGAKNQLLNPSGQTLTGTKLVIEGTIHQSIQYVADTCEQNVMVYDNDYCFGTFAVIPTAFVYKPSFKVVPYVEDILTEAVGPRDILKCVTVFLEVI